MAPSSEPFLIGPRSFVAEYWAAHSDLKRYYAQSGELCLIFLLGLSLVLGAIADDRSVARFCFYGAALAGVSQVRTRSRD